MSERQLAVVCHCNSLVDCVSKSSLTLFLQTGRHITFLRRREREEVVWSLSHSLSFQMQLSAPHGSIVILGGSRLFWIVCEAQWVTESTFTLTHACDIINLGSVLSSRTHTHAHTHTHTHTHMHAHTPLVQTNMTRKKICTHTDKYTLNTLRALTSRASCWAGLLFSPPLSRTHRAPGWRRGPSVSQHCPLPRSLFLGMAALSSWLGWMLSVCRLQAAGCLVLPGIYNSTRRKFPPPSHQWKHESYIFSLF